MKTFQQFLIEALSPNDFGTVVRNLVEHPNDGEIVQQLQEIELAAWGNSKTTGIMTYDATMYVRKLAQRFSGNKFVILAKKYQSRAGARHNLKSLIVAVKVSNKSAVALREFFEVSDIVVKRHIQKLDPTKDNFSDQNVYLISDTHKGFGSVPVGASGEEGDIINGIEIAITSKDRQTVPSKWLDFVNQHCIEF